MNAANSGSTSAANDAANFERSRKESPSGNDASLGQFVAGFADVGIHTEHLVQNNDSGSRQDLRPLDVSAKRAVRAFYGDAIIHCVLLTRPPLSGLRRC